MSTDQSSTTLGLNEAQEALKEIVNEISKLASGTKESKLFIHGINSISIELKVPAIELKLEVSGPQEGGTPSSADHISPDVNESIGYAVDHHALPAISTAKVALDLADLDLAEYASSAAIQLKRGGVSPLHT